MHGTAPTIGHNSRNAVEAVELEPAVVYRDPELLEQFFGEIEQQIERAELDVSNATGRKEVASLAYSISRRKTAIAAAGKELTEEARRQTAVVNEVRRKVEDRLDTLRDKAREPLNAWEQAEKKREEEVSTCLTFLERAQIVGADESIDAVRARLASVSEIIIDVDQFAEHAPHARGLQTMAIASLKETLARMEIAERDRAELARLRAEAAAREEEEKKAAAEAEAKRRAEEAEAERKRRADEQARLEAERIATAEKRAAEQAAEAARLAAEQAAEAARREADAKLAEERRQREAAEAQIAAEAQRKEDEARAEKARQADQEHRGAVMKAAKEALMQHGDIREDAAKKIVLAICAGSIPSVTMRF